MSELPLIRWDAPGPYEIAFSTRLGGVSGGRYRSLNIGLLTEDERSMVEENRSLLCRAAGADAEHPSWPRQVHGSRVVPASERGEPADGVWTDEPGTERGSNRAGHVLSHLVAAGPNPRADGSRDGASAECLDGGGQDPSEQAAPANVCERERGARSVRAHDRDG